MARKSKVGAEVNRLIEIGYADPKILSIKTGLGLRQCQRYLEKAQREANLRFKHLMGGDFIHQYFRTLDGIGQTVYETNEDLKKLDTEYDDMEKRILQKIEEFEGEPKKEYLVQMYLNQLQSLISERYNLKKNFKIQRDKAYETKNKLYNGGLVVLAMDEFIKHNTPEAVTLPQGLNTEESKALPDEVDEVKE